MYRATLYSTVETSEHSGATSAAARGQSSTYRFGPAPPYGPLRTHRGDAMHVLSRSNAELFSICSLFLSRNKRNDRRPDTVNYLFIVCNSGRKYNQRFILTSESKRITFPAKVAASSSKDSGFAHGLSAIGAEGAGFNRNYHSLQYVDIFFLQITRVDYVFFLQVFSRSSFFSLSCDHTQY